VSYHPDHATARYEGRPLPRPGDEVQDQGLGFDLDTLLGRRRVLRALGLGAAAFGIAACGTSTTSTSGTTHTAAAGASAEIPEETAGPYPGDGSNGANVLTQSGIVRSDIRTSFGTGSATAHGVPATIELTVTDIARGNVPFAGVAVYVWHCNRDGKYSLYSSGVENENYLRGVQITDAAGKVRFTSIFPACYSGRWPHIHFEVYPDQASITDAGNAIATSQIALPQDVASTVYAQGGYEQSVTNLAKISLATDNVFGNDSAAHQLGTVTGNTADGYAVSLAVAIDTTTTPSKSDAGGGAPPAGGTPPAGGPPSGASGTS
jgi:protocatechuate 3,4-dioxygenase beta subunit